MIASSSARLMSVAMFFLAALVFTLLPELAYAQGMPAGVCTTDAQYALSTPAPGSGMASQITFSITQALSGWVASSYGTAASYASPIIKAAISLYVVIYGIYFMLGLVPMNIADLLIRIIKISIVSLIAMGSSWSLFNGVVVQVFNGGVDYFIGAINSIAVGMAPGLYANAPFAPIDNAVSLLLSARMVVTLVGFAFTGPYGAMYTFLILIGLVLFGRCVLEALWVYMLSLVVRTLLLGLAPIFIPTILFSRTRHLFDGWLNQILNTCFQPIFVFTFFGFFSKMVEASVWRILYIPICWTPMATYTGTPLATHFWRPTIWEGGRWVMYSKEWTFTGIVNGTVLFPLNIIEVGIFLVVSLMALRFNTVAVNAAKEIAGASTSLNVIGSLPNLLQQLKGALKNPNAQKMALAAATGAAAGGALAAATRGQAAGTTAVRPALGGMFGGGSGSGSGSSSGSSAGSSSGDNADPAKSGNDNKTGDAALSNNRSNPSGTEASAGSGFSVVTPDGKSYMDSSTQGGSVAQKLGWADASISQTFLRPGNVKNADGTLDKNQQASQEVSGAMALLKGGDVKGKIEALEKMRKAKDLTDQGASEYSSTRKDVARPALGQGPSDPRIASYVNASDMLARGIKQLEDEIAGKDKPAAGQDKDKNAPADARRPEVRGGAQGEQGQLAAQGAPGAPGTVGAPELTPTEQRSAEKQARDLERISKLSLNEAKRQLRRERLDEQREFARMNNKIRPLERDMVNVSNEVSKEMAAPPTRGADASGVKKATLRDVKSTEKRFEKLLDSATLKNYMRERGERKERIAALEKQVMTQIDKKSQKEVARRKENDERLGRKQPEIKMNDQQRTAAAALLSAIRNDRPVVEEKKKEKSYEERMEEAAAKLEPRSEARARYESKMADAVRRTNEGLDGENVTKAQTRLTEARKKLQTASKNGQDTHQALREVAQARASLKKAQEAADPRKALSNLNEELREAGRRFRYEETVERRRMKAGVKVDDGLGDPDDDDDDDDDLEIAAAQREGTQLRQELDTNIKEIDDLIREVNSMDSPAKKTVERLVKIFTNGNKSMETMMNMIGNNEGLASNDDLTSQAAEYESALDTIIAQFGGEGMSLNSESSWRIAQARMQEQLQKLADNTRAMDQHLKAALKAQQEQMEDAIREQQKKKAEE